VLEKYNRCLYRGIWVLLALDPVEREYIPVIGRNSMLLKLETSALNYVFKWLVVEEWLLPRPVIFSTPVDGAIRIFNNSIIIYMLIPTNKIIPRKKCVGSQEMLCAILVEMRRTTLQLVKGLHLEDLAFVHTWILQLLNIPILVIKMFPRVIYKVIWLGLVWMWYKMPILLNVVGHLSHSKVLAEHVSV
jgi:hypothetical protein